MGARTSTTLSEHASKALVARYGVPVAREALAADADAAARAGRGASASPWSLKLCGDAHRAQDRARSGPPRSRPTPAPVRAAAAELLGAGAARRRPRAAARRRAGARPARADRRPGARSAVRAVRRARARRHLHRGPRRRRVRRGAARTPARRARLIDGLRTQALLGRLPRRAARSTATRWRASSSGSARLGVERPDVRSVDLNPLIVRDGQPVAVDALVELDPAPAAGRGAASARTIPTRCARASAPLFHPRGVIVAGVSSHPGQVRLRRLPQPAALRLPRRGLRREPRRRRGARTGDPARRRARCPRAPPTWSSCARRRRRTPTLLRTCAARGVRAAFVASGGYGEAGPEGKSARGRAGRGPRTSAASCSPGRTARAWSRPPTTCAPRSSRPTRRPGRISVASQSGNLCSALLNYAVLTGIGVSKAISCGNSAQTTIADYLDYFAVDPETAVALAYSEGVGDGRAFLDALRRLDRRQAARPAEGRRRARGPARRRQPHRLARDRRPRLRRHLPPARRAARADGRAGLRVGRHVRDPAAAARAARGRSSPPRAAGACSPPTRAPPPVSS